MRKFSLAFLLFFFSVSVQAAFVYWLLGSLAVHLAAIYFIQFDSSTNQPTGTTVSVLLNKSNPDERNLQIPPGWTDPNTPPSSSPAVVLESWSGGGGTGTSAEAACNSAASAATTTYGITYIGELGSCWNSGQSCSCRLTNTDGNFFDVTVSVDGTTTDCPAGYAYDSSTSDCQLVDPNSVLWPESDSVVIVDATESGYECNSHDPDCQLLPDGLAISGNSITTSSPTQTLTVRNNGSGNGTTITIQDSDGSGNNTSWTQHQYSDSGNLQSTQTGIGTAPGDSSGGNGQQTGVGNCGGPNQVPCDVSLSLDGMPSDHTSGEYDSLLDDAFQPAIDGIGDVNMDHSPTFGDWNWLVNAFPSGGSCGDMTISVFGHSVTLPFSRLALLQDIVAWIFYIYTALSIFNIAITSNPK